MDSLPSNPYIGRNAAIKQATSLDTNLLSGGGSGDKLLAESPLLNTKHQTNKLINNNESSAVGEFVTAGFPSPNKKPS